MEMEPQPMVSKPDFSNPDPEGFEGRLKSSLRLQYEAQVRVIQGQIGDLEKVRLELGLSQRKIAQLLLVDPSAWTRWNRPGEEAPPHIWRALQWYLSLREKIPGLTPAYFLHADPKILNDKTLRQLQSEKEERERHVSALESRLRELEFGAPRALAAAEERLRLLEMDTRRLRRWSFFWTTTTLALLLAAVAWGSFS